MFKVFDGKMSLKSHKRYEKKKKEKKKRGTINLQIIPLLASDAALL